LRLSGQQASTASSLDLLLSLEGEKFSLDNKRNIRELALAQHLEITRLHTIKHGGFIAILSLLVGALGKKRPELVNIDSGAVLTIFKQMPVSHTDLTEVPRMELIHQNTVVVLATSITTTTRMLSVLADTAMTSTDVPALLAVLGKTGRHCFKDFDHRK